MPGYETVMINCNPETVSTDYDTSDRLYFEPLTDEDVANVLEAEQAAGGRGRRRHRVAGRADPAEAGAARCRPDWCSGTSPASIDLAEDRERWNALCHELGIPQPPGGTATTTPEALAVAGRVGYPVLLRPSYVLGGRAMEIVYDDEGVRRVMEADDDGGAGAGGRRDGRSARAGRPLLGGRGRGRRRRGARRRRRNTDRRRHGARRGGGGALGRLGLRPAARRRWAPTWSTISSGTPGLWPSRSTCAACINVQFAVKDGQVYVLEANPRASRTVPFVAKATGVPLAMVASRVMVGQTLAELRAEGLLPPDVVGRVPVLDHVSVKEAVLPFDRFPGVDTLLGPEMRSTGEVMGVDSTFGLAFAKSQMAAGTRLPDSGTVFLSLADRDKPAGLEVARAFSALGFSIAATLGTAGYLRSEGLVVDTLVAKVGEEGVASDAVELIAAGQGPARREHAAGLGPRADGAAHPDGRRWPTRCPASPRWRRPGPRPAGIADARAHPLEVRALQDLHPDRRRPAR